MEIWIALLRGINVGGKHILPMKELVRLLESLKLRDVTTYIQSGNVVFRSAAKTPARLADKIAAAIEADYGFRPHVLVFGADRLQESIASNPFAEGEAEPKTLHLFFLGARPDAPDLESLTKLKATDERFHLADDVFYLYAPNGIARSKLAAQVEKSLGVPVTARNWRTTQKLMELVERM